MNINDRYRGDTYPITLFLYDTNEAGEVVPVQLATTNSTVRFSFRKGSKTGFIDGTVLSDLGEVQFPVASDSFGAGKYMYDVQVTNGLNAEIRTYVVAEMNIKNDVTQ